MYDYDNIDNDNTKKIFCKTFFENNQIIFQNFLFRDDLFKKTFEKIKNKNKAIIVQNIILFIVFSAKNLTIYNFKHFKYFYEIINEV